jgi:hypothetical protein
MCEASISQGAACSALMHIIPVTADITSRASCADCCCLLWYPLRLLLSPLPSPPLPSTPRHHQQVAVGSSGSPVSKAAPSRAGSPGGWSLCAIGRRGCFRKASQPWQSAVGGYGSIGYENQHL